MIFRALLCLVALLAVGSGRAGAIDLRQRSESGNKQFIVFSEDVRLRQRVASFAETVKTDFLTLLGEGDFWKGPIVITLARATTLDQGEPPARLRVAETDAGFKIEITVKIGDDPAAVNFHKVLLRAILLEYAYRPTGIIAGQQIVDPPWWVVEGMLGIARRREGGMDAGLFRRLVETNRLPPIENFVNAKPEELGPTAMAVDRALSMCLLELVVAQPDGRASLGKLLRDWPKSNGDPVALLTRNFAGLGSGPVLQKWWTLSLAKFSVEDRYQAMTAEETEKALLALLQIDVAAGKGGEKKTFQVADYAQFIKLAASHDALATRHTEIVELSTKANFLFRPVMAEYEEIYSQLNRGKTRGLKERLAKAEEFRQRALKRTSDIADYLNWFEATQASSWSGTFENYLKTAEQLSEQDRKQKGIVGRYLDDVEKGLQESR